MLFEMWEIVMDKFDPNFQSYQTRDNSDFFSDHLI